ncbi:MAG TPA: NADH-quinone oxidoreductase subunit J [Candidatus Polarisedimenticolaceae bacterium]|nr:NADH-quinone oxidoreductase subunit J [Candidatus Polarisedimenticolaceae bacterium]
MRDAAFWALAVLVLAGAAVVVSARSLFRAAFALAATLLATAGLYVLLRAPLLAAIQIILYTGGILTLTVFALVVAGGESGRPRWRRPWPAAVAAVAVFAALGRVVAVTPTPPPGPGLESGAEIGASLFGAYLVPFELLSVLLLGAVFGALLLARKDTA